MNLANILTMSRFVLTIIFVVLLNGNTLFTTLAAALVFTVAAITDFLDGYFAKKYRIEGDFGKMMDPIADKFLMLSAFIMFVQMGLIAGWMVWLIFIREVAVTFSRMMRLRLRQIIAAEKAGKIKTVFQITSIGFILIFLILEQSSFAQQWSMSGERNWLIFINSMMLITVLLTVYSGVLYFLNLRKLPVV